MDPVTFDNFRNLIYEKSGINLSNGKRALVCARLSKRMRVLGIDDYSAYLKHIIKDKSGQEIVHLLDAISTNVTHFFREPDHFDFLDKVIKKWHDSGQSRFRIWSAACSTGEEPYSIAITIHEAIGETSDTKILSTDISTRVLEKAQAGMYQSEKLDQLPQKFKNTYFERSTNFRAEFYTVKPILKDMIFFRRLNLSKPPFPMRGPMDVVFCRNVMIYFDNNIRRELISEIHRLLRTRGYLIVGHTESLIGFMKKFRPIQPAVYEKLG